MSDRRLAAVMVTDMVGFTTLMGADQDRALELLRRGHEIFGSIVATHGGEWLNDTGDRSLSAFPSAIEAIRCALEIQARMRGEPELNFRIGVDVGEIVRSGTHSYGDAIIIASLIERLADPGGLVITGAAYAAVEGHLELDVVDLGQKVLKNVAHPVKLYALTGSKKRTRAAAFGAALFARRVPHILGAYLAASWLSLEVTEWLSDHGVLGSQWPYAVITGMLVLIPSVIIIAYSHGAHGRERLTIAERVVVPINVVAAAIVATIVHQNVEVTPGAEPFEQASVAVLPFINAGDRGSTDYFGRGFAEDLIDALDSIPGVYVSSHTSSFMFAGEEVDAREIARRLRVATILEGSVLEQGDTLVVTAALINARNNRTIWMETFDGDTADIFSIQEDIARAVARELIGILEPSVDSVLAEARAATVEAYEFYVEGLGYLRQPPTVDTLSNARALLNQALEEDPEYAKAYAALCEVAIEQYLLDRSSATIDVAVEACLSAVRLDNRSREIRQALGVLYRYTGDYARSEGEFRRLLAEQTTPQALAGLASTSEAQGNYDLAEGYFQDAINLEPGNWQTQLALGEFYYWRCRYDDALRVLRRVIELSPDNSRAHRFLGAVYGSTGDVEASLEATLEAIEISPTRAAYRDLGITYQSVGEYDKAIAAFREALALGPDDHATWGSLGDTYAQMDGQAAAALDAYGRAARLAEDLLDRNPMDWMTMASLAWYHLNLGADEDSQEEIRSAVENRPTLPDLHLVDAAIKIRLDQHDQALAALESAIELGCQPKWMIADDPRFDTIKDDDRFKSLVSE